MHLLVRMTTQYGDLVPVRHEDMKRKLQDCVMKCMQEQEQTGPQDLSNQAPPNEVQSIINHQMTVNTFTQVFINSEPASQNLFNDPNAMTNK